MTTKKIKTSDILGDNYYIYELRSSNYTPALNGTITITCTVTDVYGDPINNKSITLYKNGTSVSTQTTNSSGVATWSITCSTAGLQIFSIKDTSIEVFVDNKEDTSNKVTSLSSSSTDTQYPSAKCVYDTVDIVDDKVSVVYNTVSIIDTSDSVYDADRWTEDGTLGITQQSGSKFIVGGGGGYVIYDGNISNLDNYDITLNLTPSKQNTRVYINDNEIGILPTSQTSILFKKRDGVVKVVYDNNQYDASAVQIVSFNVLNRIRYTIDVVLYQGMIYDVIDSIPSKTSDLTNDSGFLTSHQHLKTINNESIIGTGNIEISVGENYGTFSELQTIINNAQNNDTIILEKDYQCQNGEDPIQVYNYININGNGHIIDGNNMSNIGMYGGNLYNVKFINCHSDYNGGAVYSFGTMKIDNCLFMNNTSGGSGGALDFESDDSVVTNCVFINNKSQSNGGVLYSECEGYKFINCIFSNNSSDYDGGALWVAPYEDNNVTIKDCIFVDNTANRNGGGIYAYTHEEIKVYNCTFIESSLYNTRNVNYLTSSAITGMLTSSDIADNLTTDSSTKVLSAKQGKALNDLIGQAISYINQ